MMSVWIDVYRDSMGDIDNDSFSVFTITKYDTGMYLYRLNYKGKHYNINNFDKEKYENIKELKRILL